MRRSSRGNPWHDARGRFCSGPQSRADWTYGDDGNLYVVVDEEEKMFSPEEVEVNGGEEITVANYIGMQRYERENYDSRTIERLNEELCSMEPCDEFGEKVQMLHEIMEKDEDYHEACERRRQLAEEYNELAGSLAEKSKE